MTGYPWQTGDELLAADLNAAIANSVAIGGGMLPLTGGTLTGPTILANNVGLRFTETSGHTGSGLIVDASNILHLQGTGPAGSAADILNVQLASTTSTVNVPRNMRIQVTNASTTTMTSALATSVSLSGTTNTVNANAHLLSIPSDTVTTPGGSTNGVTGFTVDHHVTGAGATGNRVGIGCTLHIDARTGNTGPTYYVGVSGGTVASTNDNGIAGVGNSRGNVFGSFFAADLLSGATYYQSIVGMEIDLSAQAGSSVSYIIGEQIVFRGTHVVDASSASWGYSIATQATTGVGRFDYGWLAGAFNGWWAIKATGTIFGAVPSNVAGGPAMQAANGIDFSAVAFSSAAFKSTGFQVDGAGHCSPLLANAANDAAAATAGVPIGAMYRNGNAVQVRLV